MALNREDSDSDSDLEPGQLEVSNVLRQLRRSDVVRFSPTDGNMVMSGEIQDEPTIDENGNVISIVMKYLDTYKKGASQTYRCPAGFRWIILEEIDTPQFSISVTSNHECISKHGSLVVEKCEDRSKG